MYCKHCGAQIDSDSLFCTSCGGKQQAQVTENASPPPPPPQQSSTQAPPTTSVAVDSRPPSSVTFGEAIRLLYTRAFDFSGRSVRSEYWYVILYNTLMGLVLSIPGLPSWLDTVWSLVHFIPGLALVTRRLHDVGRSGYVYWFGLVPAIILTVISLSWLNEPFNESLYTFVILLGIATVAVEIWVIVLLCKDSVGDNEWGLSPYPSADAPPSGGTAPTASHQWRCSCGQLISTSPCPYCGTTYATDISEGSLKQRLEQELTRPELNDALAALYRRYLQAMYTYKSQEDAAIALQSVIDECDARDKTDILAAMLEQCRRKLGVLNLWRCPGCGKILPRSKTRCDSCYYESPRKSPAPPASAHKDANGKLVCPVCHTIQHGESYSCYNCGQAFINGQQGIPYWCGSCGKEGPYDYDCPECNSSAKIINR